MTLESWRWAPPERKGDERRGERVGVWVMRGATTPTANRRTGRAGLGSRGAAVGAGGSEGWSGGHAATVAHQGVSPGAADRARAPNRQWRVCLPPGAAHPRPHAGQLTRATSWRVRGFGVAGRPLGHGQNPQAGSRFESRPRPRRGRPLPPSGGYWRRRVAVGGWPIRGTRGGARKRCARRRGARVHAAADRGPRAPPPPCRRRRWRPTGPRTHRRGGEGGRRSGPVGKVERWAQRTC